MIKSMYATMVLRSRLCVMPRSSSGNGWALSLLRGKSTASAAELSPALKHRDSERRVSAERPVERRQQCPVGRSQQCPVGRSQQLPVERRQQYPVGRSQQCPVGRSQQLPVERRQQLPVGRSQQCPVGRSQQKQNIHNDYVCQ